MDNVNKKLEQLELIGFMDCKDVDEIVDNKRKSVDRYKNTVKVLTLKVDQSIVEGNLIDIPFICYYKTKEPISSLEYVWFDSQGNKRGIDVRGSKHGVPDEFCYELILALFRIYVKNNPKVLYDEQSKQWGFDKTINFTFRELAREVGYKSFGSSTLQRLDKALEQLNDTTIYNKSEGGFYDVQTKEVVTDQIKESFKIIHGYKSYRRTRQKEGEKNLSSAQIKEVTSVKIDDFFYESLKNSYFKIYDYDKLQDIKSGVAKKLFLLLTKWRGERKTVFFKLNTLYERIPLDDTKDDKYRKRRVKQAVEELVDIGFLKNFEERNNGYEFTFENKKNKEIKGKSINENNFDSILEIVKYLRENGLTDIDINKYCTFENLEMISKLINKNLESISNSTDKREFILYLFGINLF